jgi:hypothetical protein
LAMRVSQLDAEAVAAKHSVADNDNSDRRHILTILGSSMGRRPNSHSSTSSTTKANQSAPPRASTSL